MAMINCSECGREISDKAKKCPKCGFPIAPKEDDKDSVKKKAGKKICIIIIYILMIITGVIIADLFFENVIKTAEQLYKEMHFYQRNAI